MLTSSQFKHDADFLVVYIRFIPLLRLSPRTRKLVCREPTPKCSEAHAVDTWPLGLRQELRDTKTLPHRCENANEFLRTEGFDSCKVLVDVPPENCEQAAAASPMDPTVNMGAFEKLFTPWPLRFYVVDGSAAPGFVRVSWIGTPEGDVYDTHGLFTYLKGRLT